MTPERLFIFNSTITGLKKLVKSASLLGSVSSKCLACLATGMPIVKGQCCGTQNNANNAWNVNNNGNTNNNKTNNYFVLPVLEI